MAGSKGGRTTCDDYSPGVVGSTHHQLHERELRGGEVGDLGRVGIAWDGILVRLQERLPVRRLPVVVIILILGALPVALVCSTGSPSRSSVRACTHFSASKLAGTVPLAALELAMATMLCMAPLQGMPEQSQNSSLA